MPACQWLQPEEPTGVSRLISAIGSEDFGAELVTYLGASCSVDYCSTFELGKGSLRAVSFSKPGEPSALEHLWQYEQCELWRRDQALLDAWSEASHHGYSGVRVAPGDVRDRELRRRVYPELVDRVLVCVAHHGSMFGISLLRWDHSVRFIREEVDALQKHLQVVIPSIERHAHILGLSSSVADALSDVAQAERCFAMTSTLTMREREVCSRTVCGQTALEIASELGISAETVKCYRARAYARLEVTGERELLVLFVRLWQRWRQQQPRRGNAGWPAPRAGTARESNQGWPRIR